MLPSLIRLVNFCFILFLWCVYDALEYSFSKKTSYPESLYWFITVLIFNQTTNWSSNYRWWLLLFFQKKIMVLLCGIAVGSIALWWAGGQLGFWWRPQQKVRLNYRKNVRKRPEKSTMFLKMFEKNAKLLTYIDKCFEPTLLHSYFWSPNDSKMAAGVYPPTHQ